MKAIHVKLKKTLVLAAAGKMTLATGTASAALGKADSTPTGQALPSVSLEEIGYPIDLLTPPTSGINTSDASSTLSKISSSSGSSGTSYSTSDTGHIWAGEITNPNAGSTDTSNSKSGDTTSGTTDNTATTTQHRIDFIINGIRNDMAMQVFLAYSTAGGRSDAWIPTATGQLELDPNSLQIVSGTLTLPDNYVAEFPATPLGSVPQATSRSYTISVDLSDLSDPSLAGNNLYFQAIAIPVDDNTGDFLWDQAQVSEPDHFMIERYQDATNAGSKNQDASATASKTGDSGTGTSTTDTGGK